MPLKHKTVNNFRTNRDYLDEIFCGWSPELWCGMMMSAGFKHYAKKLGRRQNFLLVKNEAPSFQKEA